MIENIISQNTLTGKTNSETIELLGDPTFKTNRWGNELYQYRTTQKSGQYLHWYLYVEIENDTVIEVEKGLD